MAQKNIEFSVSVDVTDSLTTVLNINANDFSTLGFEVTESAGVHALDQFVINARFNSGGTYQTLYSASGDYASPSGLLVGTSGDLTTLAASATGWAIMDLDGVEDIQIRAASSNAAGSTVALKGSIKNG